MQLGRHRTAPLAVVNREGIDRRLRQVPPKGDSKGNRVRARAAPATVSGEPRINGHWACPSKGPTREGDAQRRDPRARRPACRSRLSTVRGWAVRADFSDGDVLDRPPAGNDAVSDGRSPTLWRRQNELVDPELPEDPPCRGEHCSLAARSLSSLLLRRSRKPRLMKATSSSSPARRRRSNTTSSAIRSPSSRQELIEDQGYSYVPDVLRQVPGVAVNRGGAFGALTQVRIRGAEGNHTLVLLDGIDISSPDQGETDFSTLLSGDIERIEVLRGPQSGPLRLQRPGRRRQPDHAPQCRWNLFQRVGRGRRVQDASDPGQCRLRQRR